ncbi:MAG: cation transporter [Bacteroidaceae bacterium]|nr:cation transporter [Bacteroidaceae bacterium]
MKSASHHAHQHTAVGNIRVAFFTNLVFTVIELVGGWLTNSMAIVGESFHDLGCTLTLGLSWLLEKKNHQLAGAIINAVILTVSSVVVIVECIGRLAHPESVNANGMFWVALLGILFKGFAVWKTHRDHSINEKMVSLHLLGDCLGWVVVLINSIVLMVVDVPWLDSVLSIVITLFILYNVVYNLFIALRDRKNQ